MLRVIIVIQKHFKTRNILFRKIKCYMLEMLPVHCI